MKRIISVAAFVFLLATCIAALIYYESHVTDVGIYKPLTEGKVGELRKESLKIVVDYSSQMAGWGIAVIGASAAVLLHERASGISGIIYPILLFAFFSSFISIFMSQSMMDIMVRMFTLGQDPFDNADFLSTLRYQYLFLLSSVVLFVSATTITFILGDNNDKE